MHRLAPELPPHLIWQSKRSICLARKLDHPYHRIGVQLAIKMRKHLARSRFTIRRRLPWQGPHATTERGPNTGCRGHPCRGRLVLQLRRNPPLVDPQHHQPLLPAIKPVRSIDHLRQRRAMDKPLRAQARRRIPTPCYAVLPLTPLDYMSDHNERSSRAHLILSLCLFLILSRCGEQSRRTTNTPASAAPQTRAVARAPSIRSGSRKKNSNSSLRALSVNSARIFVLTMRG